MCVWPVTGEPIVLAEVQAPLSLCALTVQAPEPPLPFSLTVAGPAATSPLQRHRPARVGVAVENPSAALVTVNCTPTVSGSAGIAQRTVTSSGPPGAVKLAVEVEPLAMFTCE